ncbi:OLC1v1035490C2 [Oldenlandia corymbosa var. corymbosa]|uniref:Translation initiation factor IF-3 n=1 Tax=Oldenlandia corymbosa var. corymbosa TaxID=529605 RepID=A0AAV1CUB4_OLDCO|nr:OLC1v1035490C2 [Oldenlandia corymbosa var. corymbosa]
MAGLSTSTFLVKPILNNSHKTLFPSSYFFGLRLRLHNPSTIRLPLCVSFRKISISGRSGGGGGGNLRKRPPEEDPVLDISSIRSDQVRLIDEEQNNVGIVKKNVAIQMAEDAQLDLVILSPDADPPVLRIMDYNKYRYEQQKKKKVQQKKAVRMDLKELKMGYNIDVHDYSVRLRAAQRFLKDGDKVDFPKYWCFPVLVKNYLVNCFGNF